MVHQARLAVKKFNAKAGEPAFRGTFVLFRRTDSPRPQSLIACNSHSALEVSQAPPIVFLGNIETLI